MDKKESIRKTEINNLMWMVGITFVIGMIALIFYISQDNKHYITYNERSNVDYKVHLKDNEFYSKEYLEKNDEKGYVATLINKIETNFQYNMEFSEDVSYQYSYKIVADVEVNDERVNASIYHYTEDLRNIDLVNASGDISIDEYLDIDYSKYNSIISRFKDVYELNNTTANLNIYLYVNIQNLDKSSTLSLLNRKVSSLTIPLTEKTVSIDIGNNIISSTNNRLEVAKHNSYTWVLLIAAFYIALSIIYLIYLIFYYNKTKTAQMIYDKEIKSIMNNYSGYIQRINGSYDIGTSQVLKIESFNDMLEIRDTLKQPILMLENKAKDGSFFIIPATNSIIYTYALRVVDIKAKMDGKEIPTYDITEISHTDFVKKKKYTDEFIKEQITMTSALPVVDEKNVIKGNKDKNKDLYDQLEMTQSFDIKEIKKAAAAQKKKSTTKRKRKIEK